MIFPYILILYSYIGNWKTKYSAPKERNYSQNYSPFKLFKNGVLVC
jgi:hypothetical protein